MEYKNNIHRKKRITAPLYNTSTACFLLSATQMTIRPMGLFLCIYIHVCFLLYQRCMPVYVEMENRDCFRMHPTVRDTTTVPWVYWIHPLRNVHTLLCSPFSGRPVWILNLSSVESDMSHRLHVSNGLYLWTLLYHLK